MSGTIVGPMDGQQQHQGCHVMVGQWQQQWRDGSGSGSGSGSSSGSGGVANGNTTINLKRTAVSNCINKGGSGGRDQDKSIVVSSPVLGAIRPEMEDHRIAPLPPQKMVGDVHQCHNKDNDNDKHNVINLPNKATATMLCLILSWGGDE